MGAQSHATEQVFCLHSFLMPSMEPHPSSFLPPYLEKGGGNGGRGSSLLEEEGSKRQGCDTLATRGDTHRISVQNDSSSGNVRAA